MILETERLLLRPLTLSDAPVIQELASHPDVAATTLNIPHPYPDGAAEAFIQSRLEDTFTGYVFGIVRKADRQLMGAIGLHPDESHQRAEIGYWIGVPYWNQGYMSEAARRVVDFGFAELRLNRIAAGYFSQNIASRRVMEKSGMIYEGMWREYLKRGDRYYDVGYYSILRSEWEARQS
jgi:ribosomal-protein-alanine N-acetyltransferase